MRAQFADLLCLHVIHIVKADLKTGVNLNQVHSPGDRFPRGKHKLPDPFKKSCLAVCRGIRRLAISLHRTP